MNFFANGHCAAMAVALHHLTGWPIYTTEVPNHAFVRSPRGYLDASGFHRPIEQGFSNEEVDSYDDYPRQMDANTWPYRGYYDQHVELVLPFALRVLERHLPEALQMSLLEPKTILEEKQ